MSIQARTQTSVVTGLAWPENLRWRDGALWFVDMFVKHVNHWTPEAGVEQLHVIPGNAGGLGWLPDGDLLAVSMTERTILRFPAAGGDPSVHADLSELVPVPLNDMVVDTDCSLYVGNFGWDLTGGEDPRPTQLVHVRPDGTAAFTGGDLWFPNGTVITPDRRLIVAESYGNRSPSGSSRVVEYRIQEDGSLTDEQVFAHLDEEKLAQLGGMARPIEQSSAVFDGVCLDAEGAIWVGTPFDHSFVRILRGGEITDRVDVGEFDGVVPTLGGPDGRTLFLGQSKYEQFSDIFELTSEGRITSVEVDVPAASPPSP